MLNDFLTCNNVEFKVDETGKVWLNVDDVCAVRIGHADHISINVDGKEILFRDKEGDLQNEQSKPVLRNV